MMGRKTKAKFIQEMRPVQRKVAKQLFKDYVFFPLVAGPSAVPVLLGNLAANGIRNVWTFSIIFCGHFTKDVEVFPKASWKMKVADTGICAKFVVHPT
jgi:linoleoyl-CoA desaturase